MDPPSLIATYTHPSLPETHILSYDLPPPPTPSSTIIPNHHTNDPSELSSPEPLHTVPTLESKTAHLNKLRDLVKLIQGDVNVFLTARMEEEKNVAPGTAATAAFTAVSSGRGADDEEGRRLEKEVEDGDLEEEDEETKKLEEEVERMKREELETKKAKKGKGKRAK